MLSDQNDPFRMDTPANHRDGQWLAMMFEKLGITKRSTIEAFTMLCLDRKNLMASHTLPPMRTGNGFSKVQ